MKPRSQEERAYLIARYGKSYVDGGSRWKIPAALLALIGIPWLLWSAGYHSQPTLRHELISFEVIDDSKILEVICTLVARDFEKNIIGEVADRFTANAAPGRMVRTSTIPTRIKAVNADVIHCDVR
jgi:hypothetical protein